MLQPRRAWPRLLSESRASPSSSHRPPRPRPFTQNCHLLLLSRASPRPQLPFLHSSTLNILPRNRFQAQIARLLTTERRRGLKEIARTAVKGTVYFWLIVGLAFIAKFGIDSEALERAHPTPPSWSFVSRVRFRLASGEEDEREVSGLVDWAKAGDQYRRLISRLEDPAIDGAGLQPPLGKDEEIYVEGVGKTGLDISTRPEEWRRGYYQALMGAARAAEHLDTWVRDATRNLAFPPEVVAGPSNPRPKPVPHGAALPPKPEDCEPAFELPQVYYMKVLTTQGFTSRQRLDAALAYADWLRFKGLRDAAAEMHSWALDIAIGGLPATTSAARFVDRTSGIIAARFPAASATPNLLVAATAFATHHALVGNLAAALPAFLSILRTQQALPQPQVSSAVDASGAKPVASAIGFIMALFVPPEYPPAPPTGDEPATRTPANVCATAATMSHIGEILYAADLESADTLVSTPVEIPSPATRSNFSAAAKVGPTASQSAGLAWTRQAVDLAESTLKSLDATSRAQLDGEMSLCRAVDEKGSGERPRTRCSECLNSAMGNWVKMVEKLETAQRIEMRREEREARERNGRKRTVADGGEKGLVGKAGTGTSTGWFWGGGSGGDRQAVVEQGEENRREGTWEIEAKNVRARAREIRMLLRQEGLDP